MKSIASSIVVAAGIYGITQSVPHLPVINSGFAAYAMAVGMIILLAGVLTLSLGLVGWWQCLKHDR